MSLFKNSIRKNIKKYKQNYAKLAKLKKTKLLTNIKDNVERKTDRFECN